MTEPKHGGFLDKAERWMTRIAIWGVPGLISAAALIQLSQQPNAPEAVTGFVAGLMGDAIVGPLIDWLRNPKQPDPPLTQAEFEVACKTLTEKLDQQPDLSPQLAGMQATQELLVSLVRELLSQRDTAKLEGLLNGLEHDIWLAGGHVITQIDALLKEVSHDWPSRDDFQRLEEAIKHLKTVQISQTASGITGNLIQIGYQELHLVPIARDWKRPAEIDPIHRWASAVGRKAELEQLHAQLAETQSAAVTAAVAGMAGVGKSTLASLFASQYGPAYEGGVLWAQLGYTFRDAESVQPILERWACYAFEGDPQVVTQTFRQGNYRFQPDAVQALLQGHGPLLAVIDDVWDLAAVAPLRAALPAEARLLVTTRDTRIARELGLLELEVLSPEDALELLRGRLDDLPEALLTRLAEGLGRHAQALAIAAGDITARTGQARRAQAVDALLARVTAGEGFGDLPQLDQGERQNAVEVALRTSYEDVGTTLGTDYQHRFRILGTFAPPEADFHAGAAAALWEDEPDAAADFLDVLRARSLVQPTTEDRWTQHALLRAYALALLKREGEHEVAQGAHLEFYEAQADYWIQQKLEFAPLEPDLAQYRHAFHWARDHAPERLAGFVNAGWQFLHLMDYREDLREWLDTALRVTTELGDVQGQANTLLALGDLFQFTDDLPAARHAYDQALPLYEQTGSHLGQANTLQALGDLLLRTDDLPAARHAYDQALPLFEQIGDRLGQANTLKALGDLLLRTDDLPAARHAYDQALPLFEQIGDHHGQANTLLVLGGLLLTIDFSAALQAYDQALSIFQQTSDRLGQANALRALGLLSLEENQPAKAESWFQQATAVYKQIGAERDVHVMKDMMARLYMTRGNPQAALNLMSEVLAFFEARGLIADLQEARKTTRYFAYQLGDGFITLWQEATGQPVPDWLTAAPAPSPPPELVELLTKLQGMSEVELEEFFTANPEVLDMLVQMGIVPPGPEE